MNYSLQEQAITRGLRGVTRKDKLPNTYERQYFIRNKNNPEEIKTISRIYNHYSKDFQAQVTQFWVVSEPPRFFVGGMRAYWIKKQHKIFEC